MPVRGSIKRPIADALAHSPIDAAWLRTLLRHAVRCSLASSLGLGACAVNAAESEPDRAGNAAESEPDRAALDASANLIATCEEPGTWALAPGFRFARTVDYVADRGGPIVVSEYGTPCATAKRLETCKSALQLRPPVTIGRHLITTEGDDVRIWSEPDALTLLGDVDTPEEAIWLAQTVGYHIGCDAMIMPAGDSISIEADRTTSIACSTVQHVYGTVLVSRDGAIDETPTRTESEKSQPCAVQGRRPAGLRSEHRTLSASRLGDHFAEMAHMEAASVPAFAAIASELRSFGAPAALVSAAERARCDEIRHARVTAGLARRYGAHAAEPVVEGAPLRGLEAFALDNAVEGCVNETYAAAVIAHRARRANDRTIRRALAGIAADETRHAELSWTMARWVMPQLAPATRAQIRAAQRAAVAQLGEVLRAQVDPELCARAGVPDARAACALHAALARTLWSRRVT